MLYNCITLCENPSDLYNYTLLYDICISLTTVRELSQVRNLKMSMFSVQVW